MDIRSPRHSISKYEYILFRDYIAEKSGIVIPPEKMYLIETRLSKLMLDAGAESFDEFFDHIASDPNPSIHQRIIDSIAINETMWFRDALLWAAFTERILPIIVGEISAGKRVRARIWFAAVSTGQEAYSAVMCVDDYLKRNRIKGVSLSNFDFYATDISSRALDAARKGRYDKITIMRGLDDYFKTRYFDNNGSVWDIDTDIKRAVRFEHFNLKDDYEPFGLFDVIFCRYVLIYFSNELKKKIVTKMARSLLDGGVLFTGNYVLSDLFRDDFDMNDYGNLTYYTKKKMVGMT